MASMPPTPLPTTNGQSSNSHTVKPCICSSQGETILLSSCGDVLSTRCRDGPYPSPHPERFLTPKPSSRNAMTALLQCDDEMALCGGVPHTNSMDDGWSVHAQESSAVCGHAFPRGGGLRGGAPAQVESSLPPAYDSHTARQAKQQQQYELSPPRSHRELTEQASVAFRTQPLDPGSPFGSPNDEQNSIVPIQSFDYSHFYDGGNDMAVAEPPPTAGQSHSHPASTLPIPQFWHGVPTFCAALSNVKIHTVSAHPLGAHVLLLSDAGLLYSYGRNDVGQLGIGTVTTASSSSSRRAANAFRMTPTIVTPLVENGGKAVLCAAGQDYSLVVVEIEAERVCKATTGRSNRPSLMSDSESTATTSTSSGGGSGSSATVVHHQTYGFGCNRNGQLGLLDPTHHKTALSPTTSKAHAPSSPVSPSSSPSTTTTTVWLPRRVALVVPKVHRSKSSSIDTPPPPLLPGTVSPMPSPTTHTTTTTGVVAVAASVHHSAALVRRTPHVVELYTWGSRRPRQPRHGGGTGSSAAAGGGEADGPNEAALGRDTAASVPTKVPLDLEPGEHPASVSLSPHCTFVATTRGRCFSFGTSDEGMLGLGPSVTETRRPREIGLPQTAGNTETITCVSAGVAHVVVSTKSGSAFAWGVPAYAGMAPSKQTTAKPSMKDSTVHVAELPTLEWQPKRVYMPGDPSSHPRKGRSRNGSTLQIEQVCAGVDCSFYVARSGKVLAAGKRSGRLGQGEVPVDVSSPHALLGGLHLWKTQEGAASTLISSSLPLVPTLPSGKLMHRSGTVT